MAKIRLLNKRHAPFMAVEYHEVVCRRRNRCDCKSIERLNAQNKKTIQKLPASFHIEAHGKSRELDREVLFIPQVRAALKAGQLGIMADKADKPAPAAEAAPVAEAPAPKRSKAPMAKAKSKSKAD